MRDDISLFSPETQECPYPAYATLRDEMPIYVMPEDGTFLVTRYAHIMTVLQHPDVFHHGPSPATPSKDESAAPLGQDEYARPVHRYEVDGEVHQAPMNSDPPVHRCYRNLVDKHFSMRATQRHRDMIARSAHESIDVWIDKGHVDLISEFAQPFPASVISHLFGFPAADHERLHEWSNAWIMPFVGALDAVQQRYYDEKMREFREYMNQAIEDKSRTPDDSFVSSLARATFSAPDGSERPLHRMEIVSMLDNIFTGGHHTTTNSFGSMMEMLLADSALMERVRREPDVRPGVIEEAFRLESVVQGMYRHTTEDFTLDGVLIPRGSTVHVRFAAANRDERVFSQPDEIDPSRPNLRRHLAFGLGEHFCPGAALARVEMELGLNALLERITDLRLLPSERAGVHMPGLVLRGLVELKVEFTKV